MDSFADLVRATDANSKWVNAGGTLQAPPELAASPIYAVEVTKGERGLDFISYSDVPGMVSSDEFEGVLLASANGVTLEVAVERSLKVREAQLEILEEFPRALGEASQRVFRGLPKMELRLNLIGDRTKYRGRSADDLSDGVATLTFYLRASDFDEGRRTGSYLTTVAHEFHHAAKEIAPGWEGAAEYSDLKNAILSELAARLFASCVDLKVMGKATLLTTRWVRFGGRIATMSDKMIADFLSPAFDDAKLDTSRKLELLKGYQLALFWTLWIEAAGDTFEIAQGGPAAENLLALCEADTNGSKAGMIDVLKDRATDGVDAPEFDIPRAIEEWKSSASVAGG